MGTQRKRRVAYVRKKEPKPRPGAHFIKADRSRQVPTGSYFPPEFYYDEVKICEDCKDEFLFSAEEQQAWYEQYKIPHYAVAVRCPFCQAEHKRAESLKAEYDEAATQLKSRPDDPRLNTDFGRLAVLRFEIKGVQRLDSALAALRRAVRSKRCEAQTYYWLGRCYESAGRMEKAREALREFLDRADAKEGDLKRLMRDARNRLESR